MIVDDDNLSYHNCDDVRQTLASVSKIKRISFSKHVGVRTSRCSVVIGTVTTYGNKESTTSFTLIKNATTIDDKSSTCLVKLRSLLQQCVCVCVCVFSLQ